MSTPDHVGTLFEGLAQNIDGSIASAPLLDMAFHKDPSLTRAIGAHEYYRGNVLRVLSMAELMTAAASHIPMRGDYIVATSELEGFSALHRALANAQSRLATSLSMAGLSLLDLKTSETLHLSSTAKASLHSTFQQAIKGRVHLNKLLDLLTIWAASVKATIEDASTSDIDKALKAYFDEVVTALSVLRVLTKSAPDVAVAKPTTTNTLDVVEAPNEDGGHEVAEAAPAVDLSKNANLSSSIETTGLDSTADADDKVVTVSMLAKRSDGSVIRDTTGAIEFSFVESRNRSVHSVVAEWADLIKASEGLDMSESNSRAIGMKTPQQDVDEAIQWLLANESGVIWGSALLTYFGLLDYAADQLIHGETHNFKEKVSSKLLRGLAGKLEKTSREIEHILLNLTKDPLMDMALWDNTPAGATSQTPSSKLKDILVDIDFEDSLENLMDALAEEGGFEFIGCFSKVVLALANARSAIGSGKLLAELSDEQRQQMQDLLKDLSLAIGRALDGLTIPFRSARILDKGLAAS